MKPKWFVVFAAAILALSPSAMPASNSYPIEVRAAIEQCSPEKIVLGMKLRNSGSERIELYKSDLPWGVKSSLVMAIVTNVPDPELVEPAHYIDDPGPGLTTIAPAEGLSGTIDLQHRFPNLWKTLQKRDLLIFWSYQVQLRDGTTTSRQSGSVLLERLSCSSKGR